MKSMRSRMVANALLFSLLLAAGCATHRLRQAQDLFSRAASVENRSRDTATLAEEPDLGMVDHSAALNDYRMALGLINESLDRARRDLIQDDLLGTAYVLKALCLWRIADLESDTNVVADLDRLLAEIQALQMADDNPRLTLGTRDRVILEALPGLLDHDRGLRARTREEADRNFRSAFQVLETALERIRPPPHHPVVVYVRLCQVSVCRAWQARLFDLLPPREALAGSQEARARFKEVLLHLRPCWKSDDRLKGTLERFNQQMQAQFEFE